MRLFYLEYPITQTVSAQLDMEASSGKSLNQLTFPDFRLSWSHYQTLIRITNKEERKFYEIEAIINNWSLRELKIQYDSTLYLRLALSMLVGNKVLEHLIPLPQKPHLWF